MFAILGAFLIYWLAFFVACFTVNEVFQDWLYDEVPKHSAIRVAAGTAIFALLATWLRPSFETILTANIVWTLLQAVVWFGVFTLLFEFHPPHALGLSLLTLVLVSGVATLGVDSLTKPSPRVGPVQAKGAPPVRRSLNPVDVPGKK